MSEIDLGKDKNYSSSIAERISRWKEEVDLQQEFGFPFTMFYIAGNKQKTKQTLAYVDKEFSIDADCVVEFEIVPKQRNVTNNLHNFADKIRSMKKDRVLMIARGFEIALSDVNDSFTLARFAHDWDQEIIEGSENTKQGKLYREMNKHVVIVSTIGFSCGEKAYDTAVSSAVRLQFTSGIIELE